MNDRIGEHWRNVPGTCPWIGVYVLPTLPECGHNPTITTRQLWLGATREDGRPNGTILRAPCPGCRKIRVPLDSAGRYLPHKGGNCAWIGAVVLDRGRYPSLFAPERV